jgi:hypothetical protein
MPSNLLERKYCMMIKSFVTWFESLGWQAASLFILGLFVLICVLILLIDAAALRLALWVERRAIRKRKWEERKRRAIEEIERMAQRPRPAPRIPRTDFRVRQ